MSTRALPTDAGPAMSVHAAHHTTGADDPTRDLDELVVIWGLLNEAAMAVSARLAEGLDAAGSLSLPEFDVLVRLHREPTHKLSMTRLAAEAGLTSGGFTKLADRMESNGLVVRERSLDDRRIIFAALTDRGRQLAAEALVQHGEDLRHSLLTPLGPERLRTFATLVRTLRDRNR